MKQKILKTDKIVIFVDDREVSSGIVSELKQLGVDVIIKRLAVADFLLSEIVAVERKTIDDFLQSIVDRRIFEQLNALSENFEKPILLIEGSKLNVARAIHPNAVRGTLSAIAVDFRVPILWTETPEETAALLFTIAKREQTQEKREVAIRGKRKALSSEQEQEFLVCGLPNISTVLAKRLLEHFKTPERIFKASEEELKEVEGIGKEKAKRVKEILGKIYKS